jgi:hypothetical protein
MRTAVLTGLSPRWGLIIIAFGLLFCELASAQIIPTNRLGNWVSGVTVGVPGGIPNRTTIYTNFNSGATASQINSAIASCPNNQVVYLNAGTYTLSSTINLRSKSGVTLRGAGMGQTILNMSSVTGSGSLGINTDEYGQGTAVDIASGYTQGSSNLVLSSTSGISPGSMVYVTENNESGLMYTDNGQPRICSFRFTVAAVNGNTVTIWPPMPYTFQSGLSPQLLTAGTAISFFGIEDLTINAGSGTTALATIWLDSAYACWLKNIELQWASTTALLISSSARCEVRHCYIHDNSSYQDGTGIQVDGNIGENPTCTGCSFNLLEDNIFARMDNGIVLERASCNAILYNFNTNSFSHQVPTWTIPAYNCNHKGHGMMNLYEGNVGEGFQGDGYHGSASHNTLLRNWFHGLGTNGPSKRITMDICRVDYYFNAIGNILGSPSWSSGSGATYEMTGSPDYVSEPCIYRLGYPNMGNNSLINQSGNIGDPGVYPDPEVKSTLIRAGNYDFKNNTMLWDAGITPQMIPSSYFYTNKPSYFGILNWPPYDPTNPTAASPTNIPAGYRFMFGIDPPQALISKVTRNTNSSVTLNFLTTPNISSRVFATTNLAPPVVWQPLYTNVAGTNSAWQFTDTNASSYHIRFYRSSTP